MSQHYISCEGVSFSYPDGKLAINDISLRVEHGESVGIIGANGMGKSTFLRMLVGLHLAFTGNIIIGDIPIKKKTLPSIRERVGYVFQDSDSQLFMPNAYENIAFAPRNYGLNEEDVNVRVEAALRKVGIEHLREKPIYKMSGGEKKAVSIATILSIKPDIILMDEPSIALDPKARRRLINLLKAFDHTKIIATHDLDLVMETCTRTIIINDGQVIKDGITKDILSNKELLEKNGLELPLSLQDPRWK